MLLMAEKQIRDGIYMLLINMQELITNALNNITKIKNLHILLVCIGKYCYANNLYGQKMLKNYLQMVLSGL